MSKIAKIMSRAVACACALFAALDAQAAPDGDDALQLAIAQNVPNSSEPPNILKTTWNGAKVAFVDYTAAVEIEGQPRETTINRYLKMFAETGRGYLPINVDTYEEDGGVAEIDAIGFANADNDPAKELIVIVSWWIHSYDATGTFYEIRVYDDFGPDVPKALRPLSSLTEHFGSKCECDFSDGKSQHAPFKTIAEVKQELGRMGY